MSALSSSLHRIIVDASSRAEFEGTGETSLSQGSCFRHARKQENACGKFYYKSLKAGNVGETEGESDNSM